MQHRIFFPPEWYPQSAVQLTWPHELSDWATMLDEVIPCFVAIAKEVLKREKLIVICPNAKDVRALLGAANVDNLYTYEFPSNDTWARDHAAISVLVDGEPCLYDFTFNGWGLKFPANLDNQLTFSMYGARVFQPEVLYKNQQHFVLEGGSVESDGQGTILTTAECLLSPNRNDSMDESEIEARLKGLFGIQRVLWLRNGFLVGDDTDSHIDTLARFCDAETIAYVMPCEETTDEHFEELSQMELELKAFRTLSGHPYKLIGLPMADVVYFEGERLPATYANFLIINEAVLFPTYNSPKDALAKQQLELAFPGREIVGINCLPLIRQHGSLHCVTMQYPASFC